jgi:3-oxoacyl-[acyl-carrier-protein] synthase II
MADKRRVVITGMGIVSSLGLDTESFWANMLDGKCGIKNIVDIDVSERKTPYGGVVDTEALTAALAGIGVKPFERTVDMAVLASHQALLQAGLIVDGQEREHQDVAVLFGSAVGPTHAVYTAHKAFHEKGGKGVRPTTVPRCMANVLSSQLSIRFKLTGPNYVMVSACASSTLAIGNAFRMIQDGYADRALCGGSDAIFDPASFAAWNNLGVMSKNPEPEKACRPFAADRDGCVLGEGSGSLVLESLESAEARGAKILAEVLGYGESSDSTHITTPSEDGQTKAIRMALDSAGLEPQDIGFINAHGTATKANDSCECKSVRLVFGDHADNVPVASNKSFFGHMLGASGAAEVIVTALGLKDGKVPASLNLENPDPECDLNFVGPESMEISAPIAMKNSFGFGGNNAVLIMKREGATDE